MENTVSECAHGDPLFVNDDPISSKEIVTNDSDNNQLKLLLDEKDKLNQWLYQVNSKIFDLETNYLEETPMGNVVRGWDLDARPPFHKNRTVDDKERLFSFSSFSYTQDRKSIAEQEKNGVLASNIIRSSSANQQNAQRNPIHKKKKRKSDGDELFGTNLEDY